MLLIFIKIINRIIDIFPSSLTSGVTGNCNYIYYYISSLYNIIYKSNISTKLICKHFKTTNTYHRQCRYGLIDYPTIAGDNSSL